LGVYNPDFELSNNKKRLKINTCFNIDIFNDDLNINIPNIKDTLFNKNDIKEMTISEKIILNLTNKQKHILKIWFNSNDLMYNETIKYLKNNYLLMKEDFNNNLFIKEYIIFYDSILKKISIINKELNKNKKILKKMENNDYERHNIYNIIIILEFKKIILNKEIKNKKEDINILLKCKPYTISHNKFKLNFQNIRTYFLKNIRDNIIKNCNSPIYNSDIKIKTHILDSTIKLACSNYQSAISNFENGNIKHFRLRYWKNKRDKRVLEIEKCYFTKESLCPKIFGNIEGYIKIRGKIEEYDFKNINSTVKLHFNKK
jgi:hypothetical protein